MTDRPSALIQLLADLNRLKLHPPTLRLEDRQENAHKIESACALILRFIEDRLEALKDDNDLLVLRRQVMELRHAAKAVLRLKRPSPLDKLAMGYDVVGNSLKKIAQGDKGKLTGVVDVVLNLPLPV